MTLSFLAVIAAAIFQPTSLEWNVNYRTDVPYEFAISPAKLGLQNVEGLQVYADGKPVETIALQDAYAQLPILRFAVPAGTKALSLGNGTSVKVNSGECGNIFVNPVWKSGKTGRISKTDEGMLLEAVSPGIASVSCSFDVPEGCAGKPVALELDCKSLAKMMWICKIWFAQYDKDGKVLPEKVSDHRWTTHYRPYGAFTPFREKGFIHPEAVKIVLKFDMNFDEPKYDNFGRLLDSAEDARPKMMVSHIAVRPAAELPFPKYRDAFFGKGVSSREGDQSIVLDPNRTFWFCTRSSASWAGEVQIRKESQCFYPAAAGTVEAWFKPDWSNCPDETVLFQGVQTAGVTRRNAKGAVVPDQGVLFELKYLKKSGLLKYYLQDTEKHEYKGEVKTELPSGKWFHIAATFMPDNDACIFVDGKKILCFPLDGYKELDLEGSKYPNEGHVKEFYLGSDYNKSRTIDETNRLKKGYTFYSGEVDALRISSVVRYANDFVPEKSYSLDADTRAMFDFDRSYDGQCGGGVSWISGTLRAFEDKLDHKFGSIQYYPETLPDSMNPQVQLVKWNTDVAKAADFAASEKRTRLEFEMKAGEKKLISAPKGVFTDFLEIANDGEKVLSAPVVLGKNDIDVRSYGNLSETLFMEGDSDFQKANRIFNLLLASSDYFMCHTTAFRPNTNTPYNVEYDCMELLNTYCGFECGPLNTLAASLFSTVAGFPSCWTGGYHHSFEQVFFDGKNHTYDLSAQRFFPMMNNELPATLGELEEQPYAINRWGGSSDHFIRSGSRPVRNWGVKYPASFALSLNPGEKFRFYWVNNGQVNDLQTSNLFPSRGIPEKYEFEDFTEQTGADQHKWGVWRVMRFFPEYGNAFLSFDGKPSATNPAFVNVEGNSFCYLVNVPYPIVAASYSAFDKKGKAVKVELSTDGGKTFRPFQSPATYQVRARKTYLIKVCAPLASVKRFVASTEVMTNSRMLMGALKEGENELRFKCDGEGKARITYGYHEPASDIIFEGARDFGTYKGCNKHLVLLDPEKGQLNVKVNGISPNAVLSVLGDIKASLSNGVLKLSTKNMEPRFAHVSVKDGERIKTLTVLVCKNARMIDIDREVRGTESVKLSFKALPEGKYSLFTLARCTVDNLNPRDVAVYFNLGKNKKLKAAACVNHASEFYKKIFGVEGEKGAWRWDFPGDPKISYPYGKTRWFNVAEGTDTLEYISAKEIPTDLGCALILPKESDDFIREILKNMCSINHRPWVME